MSLRSTLESLSVVVYFGLVAVTFWLWAREYRGWWWGIVLWFVYRDFLSLLERRSARRSSGPQVDLTEGPI
jgi:hypothetical protein